MGQEIYVDPDALGSLASGFSTAADVLKGVADALKVAVEALRAASFVTLGGTLAMAEYLEGIEKACQKLGQDSAELSTDINKAVKFAETGDETNKGRFS
jgi:hypothetical protein